MRRILALLLTLTTLQLVGQLAGTAPAQAGEPNYEAFHGFKAHRWSVRGYDCSGAAASTTDLRLAAFAIRDLGSGSLHVTGTDDSLGGVLKREDDGLEYLATRVYAEDGDAPRGSWRVELGGHVLLSEPVALIVGDWTTVELETATLHEGLDEGGWSGTIQDAVQAWGGGTWAAGFLTGGCLDSTNTYHDRILTHRLMDVDDLEPSVWGMVRSRAVPKGETVKVPFTITRTTLDGIDHGVSRRTATVWRKPCESGHWRQVGSLLLVNGGGVLTRTPRSCELLQVRLRGGGPAPFDFPMRTALGRVTVR